MEKLNPDTIAGASAENAEVIGALLDELDLAGEDVVEEVDERDMTAALAHIEAHENQPGAAPSSILEPPAPAAAATKSASTKSTKPKKDPVQRDLGTMNPDLFRLEHGIATLPSPEERDDVIRMRPTQKKIAEKFDNVFVALNAGKLPSVYTIACYSALKAKGTVTSSDLVAALQATQRADGSKTYDIGTARSQAGQMMALFDVLKIAKREKNSLTINPDSKLAERFDALLAPPTV
jgi:hypothetical protein